MQPMPPQQGVPSPEEQAPKEGLAGLLSGAFSNLLKVQSMLKSQVSPEQLAGLTQSIESLKAWSESMNSGATSGSKAPGNVGMEAGVNSNVKQAL